MTSIDFIHFQKPNGKRIPMTMTKIGQEAADYIKENNVKISTEEGINNQVIVYFDDGTMFEGDGGTPNEIMVISDANNCQDNMDEGVELLKKRKA